MPRRVQEVLHPGADDLPGARPAHESPLEEVLLGGPHRLPQHGRSAGGLLVHAQRPQHVQRRVEARAHRAVLPLAVPAPLVHAVGEEPARERGDVCAEPQAVRERHRVDAAVDLAAPVRQRGVVLPVGVLGELRGGVPLAQGRGIHAPFAQRGEGPGGRGPGLSGQLEVRRVVEEAGREERSPGPETGVLVLVGEQPRPEALLGDAGAGRLPDGGRLVEEVALDLPAQCGVGVQEPGDDVAGCHPGILPVPGRPGNPRRRPVHSG